MNGASQADNEGAGAVREGFALDIPSLQRWLSANVEEQFRDLRIEQFNGGKSNPTYKLTTPAGSYVLRRKPTGRLLKGAHAIEREARVLGALGAAGFPVAEVHALCTDDSVIGSWFYAMEMIEGRIFWDVTFPDVDREHRTACFDAMNAAIAQLHRLDPKALGLGDYGKPGNYFSRQIDRWSGQYFEDRDAGRDARMNQLIEWLQANIPDGD